jgi:SAM-dependent methyltransferase
MDTDRATHWDTVYRSKPSKGVSWYSPHLEVSLTLLLQGGLAPGKRVIDVGGGASTLVDDLLALRLRAITVLDLSAAALDVARERLGARAEEVQWQAGDLLEAAFPEGAFDFWHDRAVLHFLTEPAQQQRYAAQAARAVRAGGHAVIGCFAPEGPERCSGLAVARRSATDIAALLAPAFRLVDQRSERHHTPAGTEQVFAYALLERV